MSVEFEEGAVCYFDGDTHFTWDNTLVDPNGYTTGFYNTLNYTDFQLNTPQEGWYIHKSEIDTEKKYNDVAGVLFKFGFRIRTKYENLLEWDGVYVTRRNEVWCCMEGCLEIKTKCTYNQLMAIAKLKQIMEGETVPFKKYNVWKPMVGEEVEAIFGDINSMRGELLALTKEYAIIQQDGHEQHIHLKGWTLRNPKSKEDILIEEIAELFVKPMKISEEGVRSPEELSKYLIRLLSGAGYKIVKEVVDG